jgi:hypothetical protein
MRDHALTILVQRMLNRRYTVRWELLDAESQREVARLLRDLEDDRLAAERRARRAPWRT